MPQTCERELAHVMSQVQTVPLWPLYVPSREPSSERHKLGVRSFAQLTKRSPSLLNLRGWVTKPS